MTNKVILGLGLLLGLTVVPSQAEARGSHGGVSVGVGVQVGRVGVGVGVNVRRGRHHRMGRHFRRGFHRRFRMARRGCRGNFCRPQRCGQRGGCFGRGFKAMRGARRFASVRVSVGRGCRRSRCF